MIKTIPILSYDKEKIEKWLSTPGRAAHKKLSFLKDRWQNGKNSKVMMKKIIRNLKKLLRNAPYVSLYSASFLLAATEKRMGSSPQQECEKESIFCVQELTKNDALWRLGNNNSTTGSL